jgi:hypothetical protein
MELRTAVIDTLSDKVYEVLERCAIRREVLYVDEYFRGVGKSTALVKLAKKYDLYLVTPCRAKSDYIRSHFGYENVISQNELFKISGKRDIFLVFDEGVDRSKLTGFNVITGIECR